MSLPLSLNPYIIFLGNVSCTVISFFKKTKLGVVVHVCHLLLKRLRQEDFLEFEVSLGYTVSLKPT